LEPVFHGQTGIAGKDIMDVVMTTIVRKHTYIIITTSTKNTPMITAADHIGFFTTFRVADKSISIAPATRTIIRTITIVTG
jgi:hypothetical protein